MCASQATPCFANGKSANRSLILVATISDHGQRQSAGVEQDHCVGFQPPAFPPYSERLRRQQLDEYRDVDKGHGRIEVRHLQCSSRLAGYLAWPGFAQAIRIERTRIIDGKRTTDVSHAITSFRCEERQRP